jgi:hypothetical protein
MYFLRFIQAIDPPIIAFFICKILEIVANI